MRILFVSNLYPPNVVGGYERLCFEAAAALSARGLTVWVLTSDYGQDVEDYPGQTVRRTLRLLTGAEVYDPYPGDAADRDRLNRANLAALSAAVAEAQPDVIFAWNLFFLDRSFLAALGGCGRPVALMLTDNWLLSMERPDYLAEYFVKHVFGSEPFPPGTGANARVQGLWVRLRSLLFPSTHAVSDPVRTDRVSFHYPFAAVFGATFMRDLYQTAGITFDCSSVVHNGVSQLPGARPPRDRSKPAKAGELRLLFAGRLVDLKGVHDVVAALPLLQGKAKTANWGHLRLTIVGDDRDAAYAGQLRQAIAASGCADAVCLRPAVPEAELFGLFEDHDIYVFPSLYEPFSLTLIQALASGIPTAATRTGGNTEIVEDGVSGLLFDKNNPNDLVRAVGRLAGDPALRAGLSAGGQRAAARFTSNAMVDGMATALQGLAARTAAE